MNTLPGLVDHNKKTTVPSIKKGPTNGRWGRWSYPPPNLNAGSLGFYIVVWDVRLTTFKHSKLKSVPQYKRSPLWCINTCWMHQYLLDASIPARLLMHQQCCHRCIDASTILFRNIDASTIPCPLDRCINNTPGATWCINNAVVDALMHQQYHDR